MFTEAELCDLLSRNEGQFLEFKSPRDRSGGSPKQVRRRTVRDIIGDAVMREPQEVINERKQAYRRVGYEQRFRIGATLDDLDLELARAFLRRTPVGGRPVEEALGHYGLIEPAAREWRVSNAALLLFGKAPVLRWHPRAGLRLFRVDGNVRRHGRNRNVTQMGRADPPLAAAIAEAQRMAAAQIRRAETLNGLYFDQAPEYPDFAWQEAIVNAFAHRDYEHQGREVEVWFYDDRMEVSSPGDLLPPVTLARLRARRPAHATRNPLIVRILADAGVMRDEGEGVARIFDEMEENALREPEMALEDGVFSISLFNGRVSVRTGDDLSGKDRLPALRTHFERRRELSNADYRALFGVTRYAAVRELRQLVEAGFLRKIGERRATRYLPQPLLGRLEE